MNFVTELFLAWRYFKPKRNAVSIITLISVIGVSLGVCVLMVVLAVMTGFSHEIQVNLLDSQPHIQISDKVNKFIESPEPIIEKIDSLGAKAYPSSEGYVLIQNDQTILPVYLIGLDPDILFGKDELSSLITQGKLSLDYNQALVSTMLQNQLNIRPLDNILIHSPGKLEEMVNFDDSGKITEVKEKNLYLPTELEVTGIYNKGYNSGIEGNAIITNLDDADDIFSLPWGAATKISIKSKDPFKIDTIYNELVESFPQYRIQSWQELNSQYLSVLATEKKGMFFVLIFIVLVAASSITNTLITVVIQKTREIGLLRALGANPGSIMRIFILQGFFVGTYGTCIGLISGRIIIAFRMEILRFLSTVLHINIFPVEFYTTFTLPALIMTNDIIFIILCTIILCTLGALIPAYRAAKLDPAKALRYE